MKKTLPRRTYVHVTVYEEVGFGGSASVPEGVTESISVDMGCVGDGLACTERQVSICAKDSGGPYSYAVVGKLIDAAKREGADYAVDVYPYYGSDVPLTQVANIAVADARSLTITPFEKPMVAVIEKAIIGSNLGITPNTVGQVIRINLPALTEQRRKELSKQVAGEGENAKVAIRNIRRDAIHHIKELLKDKQISEDEERRAEDEVQKLTDRFVKEVDGVVKNKEDELMAI